MPTSIMSEPSTATVDVRDMLCAQALALVAEAARGLRDGTSLLVELNADDVRADLVAWARQQRLAVLQESPTRLRVARGPAR